MSELTELLAGADDLGAWRDALIREQAIRYAMTETGEDRQTVADMLDAMDSVSQEGVIELTDGEPTTLRDALSRYVEELGKAEEPSHEIGGVMADLDALMAYPWPREEAVIGTHGANDSVRLKIENPDDRHLIVTVGGQEVASANHDEEGWSGMQAVEDAARMTHRAVLARVIGDREHVVQLNQKDTDGLVSWLGTRHLHGGSHVTGVDHRLTLDAVLGGGILVRTRPYIYVTPPRSR